MLGCRDSTPSVLGKLDVLESIADFAKADVVGLQRPALTNLPRRSRRLRLLTDPSLIAPPHRVLGTLVRRLRVPSSPHPAHVLVAIALEFAVPPRSTARWT